MIGFSFIFEIKNMRLTIGFLLIALTLLGCQKKEQNNTSSTEKEKKVWKDFPKSGKSFEEFVKGSDYEILQTVYGDLNNDKIKDAALIVRIKKDKKANRILLVLLKKGASYELIGKNETIMGAEFRDDVTKIDKADTVTIEKQKLDIQIFCYGPCGNTFFKFSWRENQLLLDNYNTFSMGAGAQMITEFDVLSRTTKVTVINTMKEEMPEETETNKIDYKNTLSFSNIVVDSLDNAIANNTKLSM